MTTIKVLWKLIEHYEFTGIYAHENVPALKDAIEKLEKLEKASDELPKKKELCDEDCCCEECSHNEEYNSAIDDCTPILAKKNEEIARLKEEVDGYLSEINNKYEDVSELYNENEQLKEQLTEKQKEIDEWRYHMAYLTDEKVGTPEGTKKWIMNRLDELQKVVDRIDFALIKSIVSNMICKVLSFHKVKTTENVLNKFSNEFTDAIVKYLKEGVE